MTDANPGYWDKYSNLQHVKHELIQHYLNGWFPKLGFWSGRVLYLDSHAGRGRHAHGQIGSPIVAIKTLMEHRYRDALLTRCEVHFILIEKDDENADFLRREIAALGELPKNMSTHTTHGDCFRVLSDIVAELKRSGKSMAPAFIFVDPYGFKIPGQILADLMSAGKVELFVNVIWRELNMAVMTRDQTPRMTQTLDSIFNGPSWRSLTDVEDTNLRAGKAINLLQEMTEAKWATWITMRGSNNATRYMLMHLTNHDAGRDLMKDCIWKVCPDGGFHVGKSENPDQLFLVTPEPDLAPLRDWVITRLSDGPQHWKNLIANIRSEIWREPHLNSVVRELRKNRTIRGDDYTGRFCPKSNPLLSLSNADV